ncbi:MAG: hypothetical protein WCL37_07180 [Chrysiogenales bacterium]
MTNSVLSSVTARFSNVRPQIVMENAKNSVCYMQVLYQYSLAGQLPKIPQPLDRLFCLIEFKDGSLLSLTIYPEDTWKYIASTGESGKISYKSYDLIKGASEKQTEVLFASVNNINRNFKFYGMPLGRGWAKEINGKIDFGKILFVHAEIWIGGRMIAETGTKATKIQLDSKKIPEKWYIYDEDSKTLKYQVISRHD